ncbi:MAG: hypothetical protein KAH09_00460 [Desulfobacula sp.]|nr:hypothetical protein [Desulfobacula sp.]
MKLIADNLRITKTDIQEVLKVRDPRPVQDLVQQYITKERILSDPVVPPVKRHDSQSTNTGTVLKN